MTNRSHGGGAGEEARSRTRRWRAELGLRAKLNLVLLPLVTVSLAGVVWLDYRHEVSAVMEAHGIHAVRVVTSAPPAPVDDRTAPEAVARRTLVMHTAAGFLTLATWMGTVNFVLSRFVSG